MEYFIDLDKPSIDALGDMIKGVGVKEEELTATENKTYNAPSGKAYNPVIVNVPNPSTGTLEITSNNTYDVTEYASVDVNVPNPSTGSLSITDNGDYDVTTYANVSVHVEGAIHYSRGDAIFDGSDFNATYITIAEESI